MKRNRYLQQQQKKAQKSKQKECSHQHLNRLTKALVCALTSHDRFIINNNSSQNRYGFDYKLFDDNFMVTARYRSFVVFFF